MKCTCIIYVIIGILTWMYVKANDDETEEDEHAFHKYDLIKNSEDEALGERHDNRGRKRSYRYSYMGERHDSRGKKRSYRYSYMGERHDSKGRKRSYSHSYRRNRVSVPSVRHIEHASRKPAVHKPVVNTANGGGNAMMREPNTAPAGVPGTNNNPGVGQTAPAGIAGTSNNPGVGQIGRIIPLVIPIATNRNNHNNRTNGQISNNCGENKNIMLFGMIYIATFILYYLE